MHAAPETYGPVPKSTSSGVDLGQVPILPKGPPHFRTLHFVGASENKSFDLIEDWARAEETARAHPADL